MIIQRLGPSRYASYLHGKAGSYMTHFGAGSLFVPQALPWSWRPSASTGEVLAAMGDTGAGVARSSTIGKWERAWRPRTSQGRLA